MTIDAFVDPIFWRGKRVLITGHTGFKGAWAWAWLTRMGAIVFGYARSPEETSLFKLADLAADGTSTLGDLADKDRLAKCVVQADPEIVIHLAAQPFVRRAFRDPVETFSSNVMGTVNLLEALKAAPHLRIVLVITTDKVYLNLGITDAFSETMTLGGVEPYAASKACQELTTSAYSKSYFEPRGVSVATARGGNVIGGGDFGEDRLIPDIVRAMTGGKGLLIRNPGSIRPWQYVLDCLAGYLVYIQRLSDDPGLPRALNIGPKDLGALTVADIVERMRSLIGYTAPWSLDRATGPKEDKVLRLNTALAHSTLGWSAQLSADECISRTALWYKQYLQGGSIKEITQDELSSYMARNPG